MFRKLALAIAAAAVRRRSTRSGRGTQRSPPPAHPPGAADTAGATAARISVTSIAAIMVRAFTDRASPMVAAAMCSVSCRRRGVRASAL